MRKCMHMRVCGVKPPAATFSCNRMMLQQMMHISYGSSELICNAMPHEEGRDPLRAM